MTSKSTGKGASGTSTDQHGIVRKGGAGANRTQFGEHERLPGDAIDATPTPTRQVMETVVTVGWVERDVLPSPRHRKLVNIHHKDEVTLTIDTVDGDDAPVAFTIPTTKWIIDESGDTELAELMLDCRVIDGKLYQPEFGSDRYSTEPQRATQEWFNRFAQERAGWADGEDSLELSRAEAQKSMDEFKVIDGAVWRETGEPVYWVQTFGMGWGTGTSLSISKAPDTTRNAAGDRIFPLDQFDAAVARAVEVAEERGDHDHARRLLESTPAQVTGAFTPGANWTQAPKLDYTSPWGVSDDDLPAELAHFRKQIAAIPGAVTRVDDGFGGTTPIINFAHLTDSQQSDYEKYVERETALRSPHTH